MRALFLFGLAPSFVLAQSTPNTDCANAHPIAVSSGAVPDEWVMVNTMNDANAVSPAACTGTGSRDAWFSFVATAGALTVVNDNISIAISRMEVFSGSCGSLTSIGCTDGAASHNALPLAGLVVGNTYYFRVFRSNTGGQIVRVGVAHAITNDDCAGAIELIPSADVTASTMGLQASTIGAGQSMPGCAVATASDDDVWFRFTASGAVHTVVLYSEIDAVVQTFTGSCGSLTSLWCEDEWVSHREITGLVAGQDVYIRAYSESSTPQNHMWFRIAVTAPPVNDECADAIPIAVSESAQAGPLTAFTLIGATGSVVNDYPTARDVWYRFIAPATPFVLEKTFSYTLSLYDAGCVDGIATSGGSNPLVLDALEPGTTYYLKAGGSTSGPTGFQTRALTTNDECADAIAVPILSPDSEVDYTHAVTYGATESATACLTGTDDDVWFSFTASAHSVLLRAFADGVVLRYELNTGTCGSLVAVECSAVGLTSGTVLDSLVVGAPYLLRLWTANTVQKPIRLALVEAEQNDECANATPLLPMSLLDFDAGQSTSHRLATSSMPRCTSASVTRDLWYSFTATASTAAMVTQSLSPGGDVFTELFSGTCASLTSMVCTDEPQINYSGLSAGETYHVRIYPDGSNDHFIAHQFYAPPANDDIAGAVQLPPHGSAFAHPMHPHANYAASMSFPQVACSGTPTNDVWFYFVATASEHRVGVDVGSLNYPESSQTMRIETFRGFSTIPDTLLANELACGSSGNGINVTGLLVGDTVMVRIFNTNNGPQYSRTFHPWVGDGSNPDEPAGATLINTYDAYSVAFTTEDATQSMPSNDCGVIGDSADDDIWFKFTHDGEAATIMCYFLDNNAVLELFQGPVGALVPIACGYNHMVLPASLVSGQAYHFRVYSRNTIDLEGKLGIFHTPHPMESECADVDCLGPNQVVNPSIEQTGLHATSPPYQVGPPTPIAYTIAPGWHTAVGTADSYSSGDDHDNDDRLPHAYISAQEHAHDPRPRSGGGTGAVFASQAGTYHEAIGGMIDPPLVPGLPYLIAFNVHLLNNIGGCDGLGAHLSLEPIAVAEPPFNPPMQMEWQGGLIGRESGWQTICGQFIADQPYTNITIGLLKGQDQKICDGSSIRYYIDDVTVAEVIDALCVTVDVEELDPMDPASASGDALNVFPNPANDRLNITMDESHFGKEAVIELFDAIGKRMHAQAVSSAVSNVLLELPTELREGLYLVMVRVDGEAPESARVIIRR
jgi:hypothetical protein